MKKNSFLAMALSLAFLTPACKTARQAANDTPTELTGKWTIKSVNNKDIQIERTPYMDFLADNRLSAQVGCNLYNSSYTYQPATGTLNFAANGQMTMLFCPDMATEDAIVKAIAATKKVRKASSGNCLEMLNEKGEVILTLCK